MKLKLVFIYVMFPFMIFAQDNNNLYLNRNGEILETIESANSIVIIRKHIDNFMIYSVPENEGYRVNDQSILKVFDQPSIKSNVKFLIPNYPEETNIYTQSIRIEKNIKTKEVTTWLYVTNDDDKSGWLYLGLDHDPYEDNSWVVLGTLKTKNKLWNLRSFKRSLLVYPNANVYDKPDIDDSKIIFKTRSNILDEYLDILVITEEMDVIDGEMGYWVKFQDPLKRTGWIFSTFLTANRGGPLLGTPVEIVEFQFAFP